MPLTLVRTQPWMSDRSRLCPLNHHFLFDFSLVSFDHLRHRSCFSPSKPGQIRIGARSGRSVVLSACQAPGQRAGLLMSVLICHEHASLTPPHTCPGHTKGPVLSSSATQSQSHTPCLEGPAVGSLLHSLLLFHFITPLSLALGGQPSSSLYCLFL